jgi:hypothetical protein
MVVIALMLLTYLGILTQHQTIQAMALRVGYSAGISLNALANPSLSIPFALALASALVVAGLVRWSKSTSMRGTLFVVLALDVYSFAGCAYWHRGVFISDLRPPAEALAMASSLHRDQQRMISVRGANAPVSEWPLNVTMLWGLSSAAGYDSLEEQRTADFLQVYQTGELVGDNLFRGGDLSLSLASVRYALVPSSAVQPTTASLWGSPLGVTIGSPGQRIVTYGIPGGADTTEVGLVTALQNSVQIPQGTPVAEVTISNGRSHVRAQIIAGRDTAETAYDRPDVRAAVKHHEAEVFRSSEGYNVYVSYVRLPTLMRVRSIEIRWIASYESSLAVQRISLLDRPEASAVPITPGMAAYAPNSQWVLQRQTPAYMLFANAAAYPRVWVVDGVATVPPASALAAVRTALLPNGERFDPRRLALVEDGLEIGATPGAHDVATLSGLDDTSMDVGVTCSATCFVLTSDAYYPGWTASVDGERVRVHLADYALRGVVVPPGAHVVRFVFVPWLFYVGLAVTLVSALGSVSLLFARRRFVTPGA